VEGPKASSGLDDLIKKRIYFIKIRVWQLYITQIVVILRHIGVATKAKGERHAPIV